MQRAVDVVGICLAVCKDFGSITEKPLGLSFKNIPRKHMWCQEPFPAVEMGSPEVARLKAIVNIVLFPTSLSYFPYLWVVEASLHMKER